jgi:D-aminopeptidase
MTARARDLGIHIGSLEPGEHDAITDVPGVRVGHTTVVEGDDVRTGVTVVVPHDGNVWSDPVYAAYHRLNGNGEMTGLPWLEEVGLLHSPVGITNTHSVGVVRDALVGLEVEELPEGVETWALPVVAETWDGTLNDVNGFHVTAEHAKAAYRSAADGPVAEGSVGGGTGMICHEFKGGIDTASRRVGHGEHRWTVGVLVQANYGRRSRFGVNGVPVGLEIPYDVVPGTPDDGPAPGSGSIIGIVATDAPLLPLQCRRLAQRASLGVARMGGVGENSSGDLFLAFATGNRGMARLESTEVVSAVHTVANQAMNPLFDAVVEATEEAILNAMLASPTMTARGVTIHALPHDALLRALEKYGRPAGRPTIDL